MDENVIAPLEEAAEVKQAPVDVPAMRARIAAATTIAELKAAAAAVAALPEGVRTPEQVREDVLAVRVASERIINRVMSMMGA